LNLLTKQPNASNEQMLDYQCCAVDKVRWQNLRSEPVRISLLSHLSGSGVSCQTGFSRFGSLDDTATIPPSAYVSLCFARAGSIQYNVWLNPQDPLRSMTPTARIVVSTQPT
jgi:hypothetical protein